MEILEHHKTCNFAKYTKLTATHFVGRTGNEYPKEVYLNHGDGGLKRGFRDLPHNEYPYTIKYHEEYVWWCCRSEK